MSLGKAIARFFGLVEESKQVSAEDKYKQYVRQLEEGKKLARQTEERQRKEQQALLKIPGVVQEHQEVQTKLRKMAEYEVELNQVREEVISWADACMSGDRFALEQEVTESSVKRRLYEAKAAIAGAASQPLPQQQPQPQPQPQPDQNLQALMQQNAQILQALSVVSQQNRELAQKVKELESKPSAQAPMPTPPVVAAAPVAKPNSTRTRGKVTEPQASAAPAPSPALGLPEEEGVQELPQAPMPSSAIVVIPDGDLG